MKSYILVIDDDPMLRQTLKLVLENKGYEVQSAPEGQQGLQAFRERRPDLVICDIIMPDMEGIETIMELRMLSRDCPIMAISGAGRVGKIDFLDVAKQHGATAILRKPFEIEELLHTVVSCLALAGATRAKELGDCRHLGSRHRRRSADEPDAVESPLARPREPLAASGRFRLRTTGAAVRPIGALRASPANVSQQITGL